VPSNALIKNGSDVDVTAYYDITYVNGTLEVTRRALEITAASDSKEYDGTALANSGYSITDGSLAAGDTLESVTVIGSQTVVGSSDNVLGNAVIKNGSDVDVTDSYNITYVNGTLEVTPVPSTYKFVYDVPDLIIATEESVVPVTFETDFLGQYGYDGIRFEFAATGPGDVTFKATDSTNTTYIFLNSGYWGPASGFNLPADYSATTDWSLNFSEPGDYTITFSLIEAPDGDVIAGIEGSEIVSVRAVDIMDYYRHLNEPYDEITTLDLLAAIDDWLADVTPPGFDEPITTLQLLDLIDEWLAS
jgi:hypothetical protein